MRPALFPLLVAVVFCLGCGGGSGGGGPASPPETLVLLPIPALTGYGTPPFEVDSDTSLRVGDTDANRPMRGYCGIDLTGLPPGAHVESARMRLHYGSTWEYAWDTLGDLLVDHLDLGTLLDPDDFHAPAFASAFTQVPHLPVAQEGDLDVTAQIQDDLDHHRGVSGYRFRFELPSDGDDTGDVQFFPGSDSRLGPHPFVTVIFRR